MKTKTYKIGKALLSYSAAMRHLGEPGYWQRANVASLAVGDSIVIGSMTVRRVA